MSTDVNVSENVLSTADKVRTPLQRHTASVHERDKRSQTPQSNAEGCTVPLRATPVASAAESCNTRGERSDSAPADKRDGGVQLQPS